MFSWEMNPNDFNWFKPGVKCVQRLKEWDEAVDHGEAHGDELPVIRSLQKSIGMPANKIRSLISKGKRIQAMALVEEEFFPVSSEALKTFNEVKSRVETRKWNRKCCSWKNSIGTIWA
jgi:hypothetical protein